MGLDWAHQENQEDPETAGKGLSMLNSGKKERLGREQRRSPNTEPTSWREFINDPCSPKSKRV